MKRLEIFMIFCIPNSSVLESESKRREEANSLLGVTSILVEKSPRLAADRASEAANAIKNSVQTSLLAERTLRETRED